MTHSKCLMNVSFYKEEGKALDYSVSQMGKIKALCKCECPVTLE